MQTLIAIIESYYRDSSDDYDETSTNCPQDDLQSTGHSEEDEFFEEKRKRRRRIKDSDLASSEDAIMRRLDSLTIRE